jgi:hypothetical protein
MSEARTIWHDLETRRSHAATQQRSGMLLAFALLCVMAAAQVLFLHYAAGPESVAMMQAAEGVLVTE